MAYEFVLASSQYLSMTSTPITATPLTLAAYVYPIGATNIFRYITTIASTSNTQRFALDLNNANFVRSIAFDSGGSSTASVGSYSSGVWQQVAAVQASSTSRFAVLNGTFGNENTVSRTPTGLNRILIGARMETNVVSLFFNGYIAEVAIWNIDLSSDDTAALAKGFKPTRIRPQNLVFYAPLVRDLQDLRDGLAITNNNTATVADHPRVY